ncbi:hypothetical protein B0H11DRAFT_2032974 [Mycena galericulata]|nr:hypothetical protein B0H11DRAFT_2032974 [Mycena galericulata]
MSGVEAIVIPLCATVLGVAIPPFMLSVSHKVSPALRFKYWEKHTTKVLTEWDGLSCTKHVPEKEMLDIAGLIGQYRAVVADYRANHKAMKRAECVQTVSMVHKMSEKLYISIRTASELAMQAKAECEAKHRKYYDAQGNCPICGTGNQAPAPPGNGPQPPGPSTGNQFPPNGGSPGGHGQSNSNNKPPRFEAHSTYDYSEGDGYIFEARTASYKTFRPSNLSASGSGMAYM